MHHPPPKVDARMCETTELPESRPLDSHFSVLLNPFGVKERTPRINVVPVVESPDTVMLLPKRIANGVHEIERHILRIQRGCADQKNVEDCMIGIHQTIEMATRALNAKMEEYKWLCAQNQVHQTRLTSLLNNWSTIRAACGLLRSEGLSDDVQPHIPSGAPFPQPTMVDPHAMYHYWNYMQHTHMMQSAQPPQMGAYWPYAPLPPSTQLYPAPFLSAPH
jgi:hypothetical protein